MKTNFDSITLKSFDSVDLDLIEMQMICGGDDYERRVAALL